MARARPMYRLPWLLCGTAQTTLAALFILTASAKFSGRVGRNVPHRFGADRMRTTRVSGTPQVAMGWYARAAQRLAIGTGTLRLQHALEQMEELRQALASSQQESIAVRHQLALLIETNARLRKIAAQRELEVTKVRHFAFHDELTGLPNRTLLLDRLKQALVRAKRQRRQLVLLLLDLDGFKAINDRLGHAAGDELLQRVAKRLVSCIRGADTACRYGGDEFVLLLPEVDGEERALEVVERIRARLAKPYTVDGHSIAVTASIGVAVYPGDGVSQNDLIRRADVAMYLAKNVNGSSKIHAEVAAASR